MSLANQASAPSASTAAAMRSTTRASRSGVPSWRETKTAIGTPQTRWRESTQSGRVSIIERIRARPLGGTQRTRSMASSAVARSPVVSMLMNHCSVLRKISGALERQEWG